MSTETTVNAQGGKGAMLWAAVFVAAMFGSGIVARIIDLNEFWSTAIMVPPMLLLFPMVKAAQKQHQASGGGLSPAIIAYNRRMLIWSFSYMIALFAAISMFNQYRPTGPLLWIIAVLPALPIVYFVWILGRYLAEETDEYIRMKQISAGLFATGVLLVLATIWGFLEMFGVVPHAPSWAAIPVWAIGLGLGHFYNKLRP